jgi:uncharacterized membrane-anchored protein YitT (DUF2179 family)
MRTLMAFAIGTVTVTGTSSLFTGPRVVIPCVTTAEDILGSSVIMSYVTAVGVTMVSRNIKGSSLGSTIILASWAAKSFAKTIYPAGAALSLLFSLYS